MKAELTVMEGCVEADSAVFKAMVSRCSDDPVLEQRNVI